MANVKTHFIVLKCIRVVLLFILGGISFIGIQQIYLYGWQENVDKVGVYILSILSFLLFNFFNIFLFIFGESKHVRIVLVISVFISFSYLLDMKILPVVFSVLSILYLFFIADWNLSDKNSNGNH